MRKKNVILTRLGVLIYTLKNIRCNIKCIMYYELFIFLYYLKCNRRNDYTLLHFKIKCPIAVDLSWYKQIHIIDRVMKKMLNLCGIYSSSDANELKNTKKI